jgi:type VI secretion system protein ImpA
MPSPDVLDFAQLTAPISAEKPAGTDPRLDPSPTSPYFKIKDDRRNACELERPGSDKSPDWNVVRQLAVKILTEQAKDLSVSAYLIESLVRLNGFAGLRDGFRLTREFVEKYWDGLYPLADDGEMAREKELKAKPDLTPEEKDELQTLSEENRSTRLAPLIGLNGHESDGTLLAPIARVPITDVTSLGQFALAQYNEGNFIKKLTDPKQQQQRIDAGGITLDKFQKAVAETQPAFYVKLVEDLNGALTELGKFSAAIDQRCDGKGPPTSAIRTRLTECLDVVKEVAKEKLRVTTPAPDAAAKKEGDGKTGQPAAAPVGAVQTREQALESLLKVADFFRRTEPHSPLSYALDQIVRWGRMPLPELWTELIGDEAPRKSVFKQVGIRVADEKTPPKK